MTTEKPKTIWDLIAERDLRLLKDMTTAKLLRVDKFRNNLCDLHLVYAGGTIKIQLHESPDGKSSLANMLAKYPQVYRNVYVVTSLEEAVSSDTPFNNKNWFALEAKKKLQSLVKQSLVNKATR